MVFRTDYLRSGLRLAGALTLATLLLAVPAAISAYPGDIEIVEVTVIEKGDEIVIALEAPGLPSAIETRTPDIDFGP